jgi:NADH:ubiquinone oxidoreductase subunit 4 (subunit M)
MLTLIILLPILGSLLFLNIDEELNQNSKSTIRQIGLATSLITLIFSLILFAKFNNSAGLFQFTNNIAPFGSLGIDGLSIYYILLTAFITPIALLSN